MSLPLIVAAALAGLGLFYWGATLAMVLLVRRRVPRLRSLSPEAPAAWPRLSVIVPACNEVETLEPSIRALLATEYPDVQIVVVDDRSTDGTGALAERLAEEDKRLSVVHLTDLPKGWLGKVHAMHRGVQAATGEWLLFCDADVHLSPGALGKAIAWCESKKIDFLCALPTIVPATPFVDAAVALVMRLMVGSARAWSVDDPRSSAVFGFGAFMLARRAAFARTEGFEWLKLEVADDMGLALLMKRSGARCSLVNAVGEIGIQAYPSVGAMVRALEKNNFAIVGRCSVLRTLAFAAVVPLFELAPLAGFIPLGAQWLSWLGAAGVALALAATWISARWFGARAWAGLLFPVGVAILGAATVRAALVGFRQGGIRWRGTFYSAAELRSGIRVRYPE